MAKRKAQSAAGQRAGMPLARAKRLAEQTNKVSFGAPWVYTTVGLVAVAGLVGYGLIGGTTFAPATGANVASASVTPRALSTPAPAGTDAPAPTVAATEPQADMPAFAAADPVDPDIEAEAVAAAEPAATTPETEFVPVAAPGCIANIEEQLLALSSLAASGDPTEADQGALSSLVQSTLDCTDAQLKIAGSLELFGSGLADLRVQWDRTDWSLDLAMIDSAFWSENDQAVTANDARVEFVVR